jgi:hypothetical protein
MTTLGAAGSFTLRVARDEVFSLANGWLQDAWFEAAWGPSAWKPRGAAWKLGGATNATTGLRAWFDTAWAPGTWVGGAWTPRPAAAADGSWFGNAWVIGAWGSQTQTPGVPLTTGALLGASATARLEATAAIDTAVLLAISAALGATASASLDTTPLDARAVFTAQASLGFGEPLNARAVFSTFAQAQLTDSRPFGSIKAGLSANGRQARINL